MSGNDKDDEITVVASHSGEYASSEPGSSPQRIRTSKSRLTEAEILWREAIQHYNVDPIVYLKTPQQQKRQIIKKSLLVFHIYIRKTYIDGSPKPQIGSNFDFDGNTHIFSENACIFT